jgi:subtilisin family serine protease
MSGVCGIAFQCKIIGVKVWGADDLAPNNQIAKAIRYAGKHADILSCSWSSGPSNVVSDAIHDVTRNARRGLGCPIFIATGNSAPSPISYPAHLSDTIAVGASTNTGLRSGYSQFGPEIDFLAPSSGGTLGIFTTDVSIPTRGFNIGRDGQGDPEGLYTNSFGGTSSATPLAAGIGALVISVNPSLTSQQVRQVLRNCCDKIDPNNARYDAAGFSNSHGFGRLNARRALDLAKDML